MTRSPTDAEVSTSGQPAKLLSVWHDIVVTCYLLSDASCAASRRKRTALQGGDQQHTQTQHSAHTEGNAADPEQPSRKRRKHFGVRYGAPVAASQQPLPDRVSEPKQHQQKQTINHHQVQRAKAEAQLQGRKFHLDTSSCALPNRDQLFISRAWSLPDMMTEKKKLNDTKNLLDCKDIK